MGYRARHVSKEIAKAFIAGDNYEWKDTVVSGGVMWHKGQVIAKLSDKSLRFVMSLDPTIIDRFNAILIVRREQTKRRGKLFRLWPAYQEGGWQRPEGVIYSKSNFPRNDEELMGPGTVFGFNILFNSVTYTSNGD